MRSIKNGLTLPLPSTERSGRGEERQAELAGVILCLETAKGRGGECRGERGEIEHA